MRVLWTLSGFKPKRISSSSSSSSSSISSSPKTTASSFMEGVNAIFLLFTVLLSVSTPIIAMPDPELLERQHTAVQGSCSVNCTGVKTRRVCGTDGVTYMSKCHLRKAKKCDGVDVELQASGSCSKPPPGHVPLTKCLKERQAALTHLEEKTASEVYVPECLEDGSFANVQCHNNTGYCWCVTPDGKPFTGYTVKGRSQINCHKRNKAPPSSSERKQDDTKRNKQSRKDRASKQRKKGKKKGKCSGSERSRFNSNLITLFSAEYERIPKPSHPQYPGAPKDLPIVSGSDAILDTEEKRVIEWKFSELDTDKNGALKRKEVRRLRDSVKKLVKPKTCARNFITNCDMDSDGDISRDEWSVCLGVDINTGNPGIIAPSTGKTKGDNKNEGESRGRGKSSRGQSSRGSRPGRVSTSSFQALLGSAAEGPDDLEKDDQSPKLPRRIGLRPTSDLSMVNTETPSEAGTRDCRTERLKAEELDRNDPESRIFIPECEEAGSSDGMILYSKAQCHKSTGYCWCVDQLTGTPLPGTSTHNEEPDCENINFKVFKGCPYPQKIKFLRDILDQLTTEMVEYEDNMTTENRKVFEPDPQHSIEERAARWKLLILDTNNNQVLERKELKPFKDEIQMKKLMRKCGRNFVKYCDEDGDNRITVDEWIQCLGINEEQQQSTLPVNPKRIGPNPFKTFLRES